MKIIAQENTNLQQLILSSFPSMSISKAKKVILYGSVSYRGAIIKSPELILNKGEEIEYTKYSGGKHISKERTYVPVLFEDENIIAVLKNANIEVDSKGNDREKSLFALTKNYVRRKWGSRQNLYIVNNMSKDEGGILLFAKNKPSQEFLKNNLNKAIREYHIIASGKLKHKNDTLNFWLSKNNRGKISVEKPHVEGALFCKIEYKTISSNDHYAHILVNPKECSSEQIRFVFSHIGNSVVGDRLFGLRQQSANWLKIYCTSITLKHPSTKKNITIKTSLPLTFENVNLPLYYKESCPSGLRSAPGKCVKL